MRRRRGATSRTHARRRGRNLGRLAAIDGKDEELTPVLDRRKERQSGAGGRPVGLSDASARHHFLRARRHVHEHEFDITAVLFEIGTGDDDDDGAAIGRNLRIGESNDLADMIEAESLLGRGGADTKEQ